MRISTAVLMGVVALLVPVAAAQAGIVGFDDGDTWVTGGSDTIATSYAPNIEMITTIDSISNGSSITSLGTGGAGDTGAGDSIAFSVSMTKTKVGVGWATWSHSATPHVVFTNGDTVTITMPTNVVAFDFYMEPNNFSTFSMTATADDGTVVKQDVTGASGAKYYGFAGTGGTTISSITLSAPSGANGFAVGEMRIAAVPLPAAAWLGFALLGGMGAVRTVRRRFSRARA